VRLEFLGVRGSTPSPGAEFTRYGGHTSCVAIATDAESLPTLVLDAGTGLRNLSARLGGNAFDGSILLSHLHWDHVQGIPFFFAGDRPDARVDLFLPAQMGRTAVELLSGFMAPPAFPITPEGMIGAWSFTALDEGVFETEGFEVEAFEIAHKGGRTFGYRVSRGGVSLAYMPDHAPSQGVSEVTLKALNGVDALIHDAQFLDAERPRAEVYGHATIEDTFRLGERVGAGTVVLFHHGPGRTDEALDRIMDGIDATLPYVIAREGLTLDL
jgi:phosphoribosyl 1,2-cyclic phosphodiesterase